VIWIVLEMDVFGIIDRQESRRIIISIERYIKVMIYYLHLIINQVYLLLFLYNYTVVSFDQLFLYSSSADHDFYRLIRDMNDLQVASLRFYTVVPVDHDFYTVVPVVNISIHSSFVEARRYQQVPPINISIDS